MKTCWTDMIILANYTDSPSGMHHSQITKGFRLTLLTIKLRDSSKLIQKRSPGKTTRAVRIFEDICYCPKEEE